MDVFRVVLQSMVQTSVLTQRLAEYNKATKEPPVAFIPISEELPAIVTDFKQVVKFAESFPRSSIRNREARTETPYITTTSTTGTLRIQEQLTQSPVEAEAMVTQIIFEILSLI